MGLGKEVRKDIKEVEKEIKKVEHGTGLDVLLQKQMTLGQKAADKLTRWAGSWTFILSFSGFLVLWILLNTIWVIFGQKWDPKPFIMLNLVLSCLAALQAPVILMSQNRQSEKDRVKASYDYAINRKTEKQVEEIIKQLNKIEKRVG